MALINGNEYDHIDFTKNGVTTRHPFKDTLSRQMSSDLVKVQDEEPTSEGTKIWIKPSGDSEVQVPTYEEFEELSDKINDADATIESLAVGAQPTVSVTEVDGHKRFSFGIPASNGIASITKTATDGVIDTYTIAMTDGTSTSFSVNNSDITPESMAEAITTALQDYARIDGYYPDMTVGNAEQLNSSKYVENSEPYTLRTSGGTSDIGNREYVDAVVGGTLAWNQAVRDEASENSTDFAPIVTVTDAVEDAAGVKVKIEPVQDLHGYDHPWPAGGGKNKFETTAESKTEFGVTWTANEDGTVSVSGTAENYTAMVLGTTRVDSNWGTVTISGISTATNIVWGRIALKDDNDADVYLVTGGSTNPTISVDLSQYPTATKVYIVVKRNNNGAVGGIVKPMVEIGSTATEWTPYSNICPITGWDGVKVTRTGANVWDEEWEVGALDSNGNPIVVSAIRSKNYVPVTGGATYFEYASNDTTMWMNISQYDGNKAFIKQGALYSKNAITLETNTAFLKFYMVSAYGTTYNHDISINYPATDTSYHPGHVQTIFITLPTEAGTVYGGELTVNADGSGSLVVDMAEVDMGTMTWGMTAPDAKIYECSPPNMKRVVSPPYANRQTGAICSIYPVSKVAMISASMSDKSWLRSETLLHVRDTSYDSIESFKAAMNGVQLVYELATPIAYTITASEITTLLGMNNIWADTGDLALTYTGTDEHLTLESGKKYLSRISGTDSMLLGSGQEITAAKGTDNVFDLTQMFGTAVADYVYGRGAAFFRKWFGKQWYPYNAGELRHVEGLQSHDLVGFNLFDEIWETGGIDSTGKPDSAANRIRSVHYIPVLPNTTYHGTLFDASFSLYRYFYDADKNFISGAYFSGSSANVVTPENAHYVRFWIWKSAWNDYDHPPKVCFNLSHSGSRNGEYEPYEKHSYPLDSSVILRGIPKVGANGVYWDGDRYLPDGTVERKYGVVDLGTLNYSVAPPDNIYPYGHIDCIGVPDKPPRIVNLTSSRYRMAVNGFSEDFTIHQNASINKIYIMDSTLARLTASQVKEALSGVLLVYELVTPTTETAQPYHSTQWVSDWGTEEFVSTGIVPVGTETRYPANLRDKLQHLPDAASSNGSYLITQTDGQMTLTPFPAPPTAAGKYVLRATVTNGVATFTWEVTT